MSGEEVVIDPGTRKPEVIFDESGKIEKRKSVCRNCWGMKVIELPGGDTTDCPGCKGKGIA